VCWNTRRGASHAKRCRSWEQERGETREERRLRHTPKGGRAKRGEGRVIKQTVAKLLSDTGCTSTANIILVHNTSLSSPLSLTVKTLLLYQMTARVALFTGGFSDSTS